MLLQERADLVRLKFIAHHLLDRGLLGPHAKHPPRIRETRALVAAGNVCD